jgi:hypothetical protein
MRKVFLTFAMTWLMLMVVIAQDSLSVKQTEELDTLESVDSIYLPLIVDDMPYAVVHQDSMVTRLMQDKRVGYTRGEQLIDGFRVQIYASNSQQQAKKEAAELQQRIEPLIDIPVYTLSEPPFWKVRIGNFHTREAANEYKNLFLQLFPELIGSTYIVPDKIIIIR